MKRIFLLCAVLTAFLCATAAYAENGRPEIRVKSAPLVAGRPLGAADLGGLTEISVPLSVSVDSPQSATVCALFYDRNGKFIGVCMKTAVAGNDTDSVAVPVARDVSGAASLKILITDADFRPLTGAHNYPIPQGIDHENETPILSGAFGGGNGA
ncbi:MAG: hypothetical protein IKN96_08905 [Oscillibacter sp.]|nr:hypothetical protein [Oscillibacter sp.]